LIWLLFSRKDLETVLTEGLLATVSRKENPAGVLCGLPEAFDPKVLEFERKMILLLGLLLHGENLKW